MATDYKERAAKQLESDYISPVIKVLVGPEEQPFYVHKDLICAKSKFFAAACSPSWNTAKEKVVPLYDAPANIFAAFVHWLYTHSIKVQLDEEQMKIMERDDQAEEDSQTEYLSLMHLYILADKIDARRLRNDVIDHTLQHWDDTKYLPSNAILTYALERLPESAKLIQLYVRLSVDFLMVETDVDDAQFPLSVLRAMAKKCARDNRHTDSWDGDKISWHHRTEYHEADGEK